jgi:predicted glycosyltransferase
VRVWIDLATSPHPLLFAPVARRLEREGHDVVLTVRDHAQTLDLAKQRWTRFHVIGGQSPGGRANKARAIAARVRALRAWARRERPDIAVSHNSYAQIVAARSLRLPTVTAMDFEFQPSNHLAFRLATRVLLPDAIPAAVTRKQGATDRKVRRYPGLKESLYLGDFTPDPETAPRLGIDPTEQILVVARTPPSGAIYHQFGNPLFVESLRRLSEDDRVRCVVLARYQDQIEELLTIPNCIVPETAIDSRSLMYQADLVLGAGGTMTREGALMGIPTYTLFAGRPPAVDLALQEQGVLHRLETANSVTATRRPSEPRSVEDLRRAGEKTLDAFIDAIIEP